MVMTRSTAVGSIVTGSIMLIFAIVTVICGAVSAGKLSGEVAASAGLWSLFVSIKRCSYLTPASILKAHSHSMSGSSIWASLECHCCFWIAGVPYYVITRVSYLTMWLLTLQLFKNSIDTNEKLRLNLHSLSVIELLEYGRKPYCMAKPYMAHVV